MKIYYKDGFYIDDGITAVPVGACEISAETYYLLLEGQAKGKQIISDENGSPILLEPAPTVFHHIENGEWVLSQKDKIKLIEQQKEALINKIAEKTDRLKSQILVGYPQAEIDSFYRQEREARAWILDNSIDTPMLLAIAENRGVPLEILAEKVIEKADQIAVMMGQIIGTRQGFEDRILSAKNQAELTACEQEIEQWTL